MPRLFAAVLLFAFALPLSAADPKITTPKAHFGFDLGADYHLANYEQYSEYLAKLFFDTNVFDPGMVRHLVDRFGADHVLLGTDYPFDMGTVDPLGFLGRVDLTDAERRLVLGGNAERLLRIGG